MKRKNSYPPEMRGVKTFKIVFITILSAFWSPLQASQLCADRVFDLHAREVFQRDPFESIELLETHLSQVITVNSKRFGDDAKKNAFLAEKHGALIEVSSKIELLQDKVLNEKEVKPEEFQTIFVKIKEIQELHSSSRKNGDNAQKKKQNWSEALKKPSEIIPEKIYEVEVPQGFTIKVVFGNRVVEKALKSKKSQLRGAARKSLQEIAKGVYGGSYKGLGIKKMIADTSIFEIAARGEVAGRFRFIGYVKDSKYYIVRWMDEGNHSSSRYIQTLIERVRKARRSRIERGLH